MMRRALLALVLLGLFIIMSLGAALNLSGVAPVQARLTADQLGFLPVVLNDFDVLPPPLPTASPTPLPSSPPVIDSFVADPEQITIGSSSTLRWQVSGDVSKLTMMPDGTDVTGETELVVSPDVSRRYTLKAENGAGVVRAWLNVTVVAETPVINSFAATPSTIDKGDSATLSWSVSGEVDQLSISPTVGDVSGQTEVVVSPDETTTYTLTAVNSGGEVTAETTITVNVNAPVIDSFTADPPQITSGSSATLAWIVSGEVDSLSIAPGIGDVTGETQVAVSPTATTQYTLTATNAGGSATETVFVIVVPPAPVIDSFSANPAAIDSGDSTTLSWQVSGEVDSLTLAPGIGSVKGQNQIILSPTQTTEYTLTASNEGGENAQSTTVTVAVPPGPPNIESFVAAPSKPISGQKVTLRWQILGALTSLELQPDDGSAAIDVLGQTEYTLVPTAPTTNYTLVATNDDGADQALAVVELVQPDDVPVLHVFDWNTAVNKTPWRGFPRFDPPQAGTNDDWTTPYNYADGVFYYRAEVINQPTPQTGMRMQFCVWQTDLDTGERLGLENCGPTRTVSGTAGTIVTWSQPIDAMWKKNGVPLDWDRARTRYAFAIKTASGCPVSNFNISSTLAPGCPVDPDDPTRLLDWAGEDPDDWYPLDVRLDVFLVADGDDWPGWGTVLP